MKRAVTATLLTVIACSGATDPNPTPAVDAGGGSSSSSSGVGVTPTKDSGPKPPAVTPGQVKCGATSCALPSVCCVKGDTAECKPTVDDCADEVRNCDEQADCQVGKCCAEESSKTPFAWSTYCRPSCITGVPRVEVCTSTEGCDTCKLWSCGGYDMKDYKSCAPLGPCD